MLGFSSYQESDTLGSDVLKLMTIVVIVIEYVYVEEAWLLKL